MKTQLQVLLVEDDDDDRFFAERALRKAGLNAIAHVRDGEAAIDYLSGNGVYTDRKKYPLPELVFIDLKLPQISGHQVLEWIRTQPALSACAVYILSSSGEISDRKRAEACKASGYFVKPLSAQDISSILAGDPSPHPLPPQRKGI